MVKPLFCCSEYLVDDKGFVLSKHGKPLKPSINHRGYEIVNLMIDGRRVGMSVHTAVARTFCEGYSENLQVNHKDGNKRNNHVSNLEWVTCKDNVHHAITELGFDNTGVNNKNSKTVIGYDAKTGEEKYRFPCVMDAGKYFSPDDHNRAVHIERLICGIAGGYGNKKTYRKCKWMYV